LVRRAKTGLDNTEGTVVLAQFGRHLGERMTSVVRDADHAPFRLAGDDRPREHPRTHEITNRPRSCRSSSAEVVPESVDPRVEAHQVRPSKTIAQGGL
jgi:hypothetical protein